MSYKEIQTYKTTACVIYDVQQSWTEAVKTFLPAGKIMFGQTHIDTYTHL